MIRELYLICAIEVPTFIVAGHETTSSLITWTLFALANAPEVQMKLRDELRDYPSEAPSMDEINSLKYLDVVLKETLRLYAPVNSTTRVATQDDLIPLSQPIKDRKGVSRSELRVKKGDIISIPIRILNRSADIWGPDAHEFK
jgi:cytochrome P450